MRNKLLLSSLLLCAIWVAAQTYPNQSSSQSSSQSGQTATQTSSQSSTSNGNETTVTGCLSGSTGNYMLKDSSGNNWQLTGDTSKLSEHVGHTVQIKGTTSSSSTSSSGASGTSGTSGGSSAEQTLNVTSIKHISSTCNSNR